MKVSDSQTKTQLRPRLSTAKRLIIAAVLVGVILGGWGTVRAMQRHQAQRQAEAATARRHILVSQAAKLLNPKNVKQLKPVTDQIRQEPNYTKDQSYLYVLLTYSINVNDSGSANTELKQLEKAYKGKTAYDKSLQPYVLSQPALRQMVDFLRQQAADTGKNATFGSSPMR